jgi:hypothetical protein
VFYRDDAEAGTPWVTRPPFPVHLMSTVEGRDTVADTRTVSEYRYHHGHYDRAEPEFRGFAPVDEIDAQHFGPAPGGVGDLDSPPVLTRRWYHTGVDPARGELVAAALAERWQGDPLAPPRCSRRSANTLDRQDGPGSGDGADARDGEQDPVAATAQRQDCGGDGRSE